jgi:hypothetical protein
MGFCREYLPSAIFYTEMHDPGRPLLEAEFEQFTDSAPAEAPYRLQTGTVPDGDDPAVFSFSFVHEEMVVNYTFESDCRDWNIRWQPRTAVPERPYDGW